MVVRDRETDLFQISQVGCLMSRIPCISNRDRKEESQNNDGGQTTEREIFFL